MLSLQIFHRPVPRHAGLRFTNVRGDGSHGETRRLRFPCYLPVKKVTHQFRNLRKILFQGKVARIEQVELRILEVILIAASALDREDVVVLAPNNQGRRLVLTKILLPSDVGV